MVVLGVESEPINTLPASAGLALAGAEVVRVPGKGVFVTGRALLTVSPGDRVVVGGAAGYFAGRVGSVEVEGRPAEQVRSGECAGLFLAMSSRSPVEIGASVYVSPSE